MMWALRWQRTSFPNRRIDGITCALSLNVFHVMVWFAKIIIVRCWLAACTKSSTLMPWGEVVIHIRLEFLQLDTFSIDLKVVEAMFVCVTILSLELIVTIVTYGLFASMHSPKIGVVLVIFRIPVVTAFVQVVALRKLWLMIVIRIVLRAGWRRQALAPRTTSQMSRLRRVILALHKHVVLMFLLVLVLVCIHEMMTLLVLFLVFVCRCRVNVMEQWLICGYIIVRWSMVLLFQVAITILMMRRRLVLKVHSRELIGDLKRCRKKAIINGWSRKYFSRFLHHLPDASSP